MPKTTKHILVIRLSAMGDVAMSVPVLRAFTIQYPEIKITVLTRTFFKPLFRGLKNVTVVPVDVKGTHKGILGLYKLASDLNKNNKFDAVADLHNVLRSNILKCFLKSKHSFSIDKGRKEKRRLISGEIFKPLKSTHQRYADVFEALGYSLQLSKPIFPEKVVLNTHIRFVLRDSQTKMIGIAPFAAHDGKKYPFDLMKIVVKELSKTHKVVLFGGGYKEIALLNSLEKKASLNNCDIINVAGKLSFNEELDVISNLEVMLSMDSGNAHLAAMFGVKTVTVWGVTHPYAGFAPFNQPENFALLSNRKKYPLIPTSVYGNKYPEDYKEASGSISPEAIIKKIKSISEYCLYRLDIVIIYNNFSCNRVCLAG